MGLFMHKNGNTVTYGTMEANKRWEGKFISITLTC